MVKIPRTKKIKVNLKTFFSREARKNIIGTPTTGYPTYKSLLQTKRGIKLDNAPENKPSVIKNKGKDHWLVNTGETMKKGILFRARSKDLLVYASPKKHSGKTTYFTKAGIKTRKSKNPPSYEQIFNWNNKRGYSGIFQSLPLGSGFPKRLVKEVGKQLLPQISKGIRKSYRIKWQ